MSTVSVRTARRGRSLAPRLEALEGRDCPTTLTFHDGLLTIVGDRGDDDVAVVNTWTGTHVTCQKGHEKLEATFMDVRSIDIRTMGGDDHVTFTSMSGERPAPVPVLHVDLGDGDDTFVSDIGGVKPGPCDVAVNGGAGQDGVLMSYSFGGSPSDPSTPVFARADGGAGDDVMYVIHKHSQPAFEVCTLVGGGGDDTLGVMTDIDVPMVPAVQSSATPAAQFTLDGGVGDDTLTAQHKGAQPANMKTSLLGGAGDDHLTATTDFAPAATSSAIPDTQFSLVAVGGLGNDSIEYRKQRAVTHKGTTYLDGGQGDDHIAYFKQGCVADPVSTSEYSEIDGGTGDDVLVFVDLPEEGTQTVLGYDFVLAMNGGAGNDFVFADARYFNGGGHTGSILESGGDGDDDLALFYDGPFTTLLMDGGQGTDTGLTQHSPGVAVVNCEL